MARVLKKPEIRSAELLDCAQRLFFERGYDSTTVNDIIREAGLSKGAFYHYFASKEALLEALSVRMTRDFIDDLQPILEDQSLDAVARLNAVFADSRRLNAELAPQMKKTFYTLFKPENLVLFHRLDEAVTEVFAPIIAGILREGVEQRLMDAPDPQAFAEMLLQLRISMRKLMHRALQMVEEGGLDQATALLDERLRLYGVTVDRLLKLPDGTITIGEPGFSRAFLT